MFAGPAGSLIILVISGMFAVNASAQTAPAKPAGPKRVEPGLEDAVKWEWRVAPSDEKDWGLQTAEPTPTPTPVSSPNWRVGPLSTR